MKKHKIGAIKLFFLFATLGVLPFLYPATQYRYQPMPMDHGRAFDIQLLDKQATISVDTSMSAALRPIDPALGSEVQPDSIE